jgi:hypothetical protein
MSPTMSVPPIVGTLLLTGAAGGETGSSGGGTCSTGGGISGEPIGASGEGCDPGARAEITGATKLTGAAAPGAIADAAVA